MANLDDTNGRFPQMLLLPFDAYFDGTVQLTLTTCSNMRAKKRFAKFDQNQCIFSNTHTTTQLNVLSPAAKNKIKMKHSQIQVG